MRPAGVVELDPVSDGPRGVLEALEAVAMNALLLQRPDDTFDNAVLLGTVRSDEFLLQTVAANQGHVVPAGEYQSIVRPQQEHAVDATQGAEAADQSIFQRASRCGRLSGA